MHSTKLIMSGRLNTVEGRKLWKPMYISMCKLEEEGSS